MEYRIQYEALHGEFPDSGIDGPCWKVSNPNSNFVHYSTIEAFEDQFIPLRDPDNDGRPGRKPKKVPLEFAEKPKKRRGRPPKKKP